MPRIGGIPLHTLGVCAFFAISGYLISGSWQRRPSASRYLFHRILRIFPALIVVVLLTVFLIGPVFTALSLPLYFADPLTWQYLVNITLIGQYDLPGVFEGSEHARAAVNGSLWTLGVEFSCYLALLAIFLLLPRAPAISSVAVAAVVALGATLSPILPATAPLQAPLEMATFFFVAAAMRYLVPAGAFRLLPGLAALALWLLISALVPSANWTAGWILLTFAVVAVGASSLPVVSRAGRFGDFSYGLYLYAYPAQQAVIGALGIVSLVWNVVLVSLLSLSAAVLSWHLVEKGALSLKNRPPTAASFKLFPRLRAAATLPLPASDDDGLRPG